MTSKYQVYRDIAGKYRFRLRAKNNKIVAVSEAYESKASCMNGVMSVQRNCESHVEDLTKKAEKLTNPKYEIFIDSASEFRFNLKAPNGQIVAVSEGYETKDGVLNGIEAVQRSCDAEIEDLTLDQTPKEMLETETSKENEPPMVMDPPSPEMAEIEAVEEVCREPTPGANDTVLLLDDLPDSVRSDTTVTFRGKLTEHDSVKGVGCAEIDIFDRDRSFMRDDLLASGATNNDGTFAIDWEAKQRDFWDDKIQVYAIFKGTENYNASKSDIRKMRVLWYAREHLKK